MVHLFQTDERVLCFSGPLLYDAKILDVDGDKDVKYLVHYKGWKDRYDEWVPEERVLKYNAENLKTMESIASRHSRKRSKLPVMSKSVDAKSEQKSANSSKRKADLDKEEDYITKPEVRLDIPDSLKVKLVDDWEYVTKSQQLVQLPRMPNVAAIISDYQKSKQSKRGSKSTGDSSELNTNDELLEEVLAGLKLYFDKALGNILLYSFERKQYKDIVQQRESEGKSAAPSEIYGAEHLLRLFVQLPQLIAYTNLDEPAVNILRYYLQDFLKYIQKNATNLFSAYVDASSQYLADQRS